jgi:hypothetical protein
MAKIDLDTMSIEELVNLRDRAVEKLAEKVASRQLELEAELERLAQYGSKPAKKAQPAATAPRAKKSEKNVEAEQAKPQAEEPVEEAA